MNSPSPVSCTSRSLPLILISNTVRGTKTPISTRPNMNILEFKPNSNDVLNGVIMQKNEGHKVLFEIKTDKLCNILFYNHEEAIVAAVHLNSTPLRNHKGAEVADVHSPPPPSTITTKLSCSPQKTEDWLKIVPESKYDLAPPNLDCLPLTSDLQVPEVSCWHPGVYLGI